MIHLVLELIGCVGLVVGARFMYLMACLGGSKALVVLSWVMGLGGVAFGIWSPLSYFGVL